MDETKEILEMLKQIMKRLDDLERRDNNPFPVIGPGSQKKTWPEFPNPNDVNPPSKWDTQYRWQSCPVCKIDLKGTMGYVCGHSQCPTRVTC